MMRSKLRYKVFRPQNKTVIDSNTLPIIFFSTTDNVKFTTSERARLTNGVKATMDALSMVKNAAEVGFAGHLEQLDVYFDSSSPETINFVTEVINIMYKSLTSDFSQLTFFNITKPKLIYKKACLDKLYKTAWLNKFPGAGKNPIAKATGGACSEKMAFVHDKASKKWIEQQKGVTIKIAWTVVLSSVNIVNAISREVARGALALDVDLSKIKRNESSSEGAFSIDNFVELVNPDNWGSFIAFFTEPLSKHYLQQIMRNVALSNRYGSLGETIISNRSLGGTIDKPI